MRFLVRRLSICLLSIPFSFGLWLCLAHAASAQISFGSVPNYVDGPYIADERVVTALDCRETTCKRSLSFSTLIRQIFPSMQIAVAAGTNPLSYREAKKIRETIISDLDDIQRWRIENEPDESRRNYIGKHFSKFRISPDFLTNANSRIDLVGVINRMDRQFLGLRFAASSCGEISLIYRFRYSIREGNQTSRLPITMNLVFPAAAEGLDCRTAAQRWLEALKLLATINAGTSQTDMDKLALQLTDPATGVLAHIVPQNIDRVELNIQAYRLPASIVNDFGSEASYVIRVFRWDATEGIFVPSVLPNQIDRDKLLCSDALCQKKKSALVDYLTQPDTVERVDRGLLNIPESLGVLAERAISLSPGGPRRSTNQPYWRAVGEQPNIITDSELRGAIADAKHAGKTLKFMRSASDFRTRLNDSTCTGCHQTRAIAGFHFPGEDRQGTALANSVLLPGSPHFFGDQPRRLEILQAIAGSPSGNVDLEALATSYSARPHERFAGEFKNSQLIGGWGSTCLVKNPFGHKRDWSCRKGLECVQLFRSSNDVNAGTCIPPKSKIEVGDPMQLGGVLTSAFGRDAYVRLQPWGSDTRIPVDALPDPKAVEPGNSYYGSHQEFYFGSRPEFDCRVLQHPTNRRRCYEQRRDRLTGGFPAGMLRLSECRNLPAEATCALVAASGFNDCVAKIGEGEEYSIDACFAHFTAYSGMRACDRANPCRDDYICVKPIEYNSTSWQDRREHIRKHWLFEDINKRSYDPNDFGQAKPDDAWAERSDRRGYCIPPYFVFQFRSDKHGSPKPASVFITRN